MKIFMSWAGARSRVLATSLQEWLPTILPNVELFHSDDIRKGNLWHEALTEALRECDVGIFCVTPESIQSQWMLFEAGALAQAGKKPRLFTYLYGLSNIEGPLGHFQATRFDKRDNWGLIASLASIQGADAETSPIRQNFDSQWVGFESKVLRLMALPIEKVLPKFPDLFDNRKTFHEPFPDCPDKRWGDRIARIAKTHERLSTSEFSDIMSSDPYMSGAYKTLKGLLERYEMHIKSHLLERLDFESLNEKQQDQLEGVRQEILDVVYGLQQRCDPPVFRESFSFESESSTPRRKATIHEMQIRLKGKEFTPEKIIRAARSLNWALDRIVFYLAVDAGYVADEHVDDLIDLLRIEEEQVRTRELVSGLQPLYYALECLDNRITLPVDAMKNKRLIVVLGDIQRLVDARAGRDSGGQITQRVDSLRRKLELG